MIPVLMGIKIIYLLQGTAAGGVLLPTQKPCEKCSPIPSSCHARQTCFVMYLFSKVLHSKQPGKASIIEIIKNYVMRAYQACSSVYQRAGSHTHSHLQRSSLNYPAAQQMVVLFQLLCSELPGKQPGCTEQPLEKLVQDFTAHTVAFTGYFLQHPDTPSCRNKCC